MWVDDEPKKKRKERHIFIDIILKTNYRNPSRYDIEQWGTMLYVIFWWGVLIAIFYLKSFIFHGLFS